MFWNAFLIELFLSYFYFFFTAPYLYSFKLIYELPYLAINKRYMQMTREKCI